MNRDDDRATGRDRSDAAQRRHIEPGNGSKFGDGARPEDRGWRPVASTPQPVSRIDSATKPEMPPPFRRIGNGSRAYRGPGHSDQAYPAGHYHFSRWQPHGSGELSSTWLTVISLGMVAAALLLVAIVPGLLNRGGNHAVASPSASLASGQVLESRTTADPTPPRVTSPSAAATSAAPQPSFRTTYKVQAGDTLTRIANKFGLKTWELLAANPGLTANSSLHINAVLNIPYPGQMTPAP
jgi:LysM repeat protein